MRTTIGSTRSSPCERHESVAHASVRGKRKHREIDRLEKGTYRTRPRRQASQLKITKSHAKAHSASCSLARAMHQQQQWCDPRSGGDCAHTVPMGGQHVLLAIRIEHKRRIQSEDWLAGDRRTRGRLRAAHAASIAPRGGTLCGTGPCRCVHRLLSPSMNSGRRPESIAA